MTADLLSGLWRTSVALTVALLLVLILRSLLRRQFGAQHGYAVWLLVPLLPLASLLPLLMPSNTLPLHTLKWMRFGATANPLVTPMTDGIDTTSLLIIFWGIGVALSICLQCWRQAQFMRSLGGMEKFGDIFRAQTHDIGPALVGLLRSKIVVPSDFPTRYTPTEQSLILAHERIHKHRGDSFANAFCAVLQCIFWFHPLLHFAAQKFRIDQELACDALVMRQHQNLRKAYANAMLKTQSIYLSIPVGCTWQSSQCLKERIVHLNQKPSSSRTRYFGSALLATLITFVAFAAWAAQPQVITSADKTLYDISINLAIDNEAPSPLEINVKQIVMDGTPTSPHLSVVAGEPFSVNGGSESNKWNGTFVLTAQTGSIGLVTLDTSLAHNDKNVAHPALVFKEGEWARIKANDGKFTYDLSVMASRKVASIKK